MCFVKPPKMPEPPKVPSRDDKAASARRKALAGEMQSSQGRASTVITSPLGDDEFGRNVRRTKLGG